MYCPFYAIVDMDSVYDLDFSPDTGKIKIGEGVVWFI